jgi:hypothetical protein
MMHTFALGNNQFEASYGTLESTNDLNKTSPLNFEEVKKIIKLLVYLDMPKVIERESWDSGIWTQFSDG